MKVSVVSHCRNSVKVSTAHF